VIALEEHYWDEELSKTYTGGEAGRPGEQMARLFDLGALRLKEMDEAGIDIQVISHGAPSAQKLPAETAAALTRRVNDRLHAVVSKNPKRFAAFAALPTAVPDAAADELERTAKLGFKGAMLHGLANGTFLDDKKFWPIYARAEALDLPIYLHPGLPQPDVLKIYYGDYAADFPSFTRAGWGYTVETATLAIRLVLSGVFDKYPKLKIMLGHLGEMSLRRSSLSSTLGSQPTLCAPSSRRLTHFRRQSKATANYSAGCAANVAGTTRTRSAIGGCSLSTSRTHRITSFTSPGNGR
jgi:2,3-dihydroxybenzoate decarboxylase